MNINNKYQNNQEVSKYKLLSTAAGVGSIIATKNGYYALISDIQKWKYVQSLNKIIQLIRQNYSDENDVNQQTSNRVKEEGINLINDQRFTYFIRKEKGLPNLVCLIEIPSMAVNEFFNTVNWTSIIHGQKKAVHPIAKALEELNKLNNYHPDDFQIQATYFPKWFKGHNKELKKLSDWEKLWKDKGHELSNFAPPRDVNAPVKKKDGEQLIIRYKNNDNALRQIPIFKELTQTNLVLICPNGHLSDIPWDKYLRWKTNKIKNEIPNEDKGEHLFSIDSCCANPNLKWTESKNKSEGYGSIYIECLNCKLGSGESKNRPKVNLVGINGIQPLCIGEKPWEQDLNNQSIPFERCKKGTSVCKECNENHSEEHMRVTLATANNTYYANGFSSLYIPLHLATNIPRELNEALEIIEKRYKKRNQRSAISKEEYWENKVVNDFEEFVLDNDIKIDGDTVEFEHDLRKQFLNINSEDEKDLHEKYRWEEFRCFSSNNKINETDLTFNDIELTDTLKQFFSKIQQVEELKVTNIQFDFTRVEPKRRFVKINEKGERVVYESEGKNIYSTKDEETFVLPANETFGEGLFFQFDDNKIQKWITENNDALKERYNRFLDAEIIQNEQGAGSKQTIKNNGIKQFLIHSFSHLMMRELEFSCGYPTASLKERLYISNTPEKRMSGVLIYTAEGSEGSMGGLISQGEPEKIFEIIKRGLERSVNCSSDPLCWESDGQGIFDLNLSACFSCSLVSETACEEMNLGLDRRVLSDEQWGFFKTLLFE